MRIKIKKRERPNNGAKRIKTKFLLFPRIIDKEFRWLEKATYSQLYLKYDSGPFRFSQWINVEWKGENDD